MSQFREFYELAVAAEKAVGDAANAKLPEFDSDLGLSEQEFSQMISELQKTAKSNHEALKEQLKKYEISQ